MHHHHYRRTLEDSLHELNELDAKHQPLEQVVQKTDEAVTPEIPEKIRHLLNTVKTNKDALEKIKEQNPGLYHTLITLMMSLTDVLKDMQGIISEKESSSPDVTIEPDRSVSTKGLPVEIEDTWDDKDSDDVSDDSDLEVGSDPDDSESTLNEDEIPEATADADDSVQYDHSNPFVGEPEEHDVFPHGAALSEVVEDAWKGHENHHLLLPEEYRDYAIVDEELMRRLHHFRRPLSLQSE